MISDFSLVKEEEKEFQSHLKNLTANSSGPDDKLECSFQCLKTANWPSYKSLKVMIPPQLDAKYQQFRMFYENKH